MRLGSKLVLLGLCVALVAPTGSVLSAPAPQSAPTAAMEEPSSLADAGCDGSTLLPALGAGGPSIVSAFRTPLAPAPLWNPPGTRRVGLQAGHWLNHEVPAELSRLQPGASGGGKQEWEVNLDLARRAGVMLATHGIEVDILPATIPPSYRAHLFLAIHADGDVSGRLRGFKITRPAFSSVPDDDDRLVDALNRGYGLVTGLPRDDEHISRRMLYYYAFNSRRYCHAVAPGVPQAILEAGFLTSAVDREYLIGNPGLLAQGITEGILAFLGQQP
jgi:hypothetical protein